MMKLDHQLEANVLRIVRKYGQFSVNPLAWSSRHKMRVLESMTKHGLLTKHRLKLDLVVYTSTAVLSEGQQQ